MVTKKSSYEEYLKGETDYSIESVYNQLSEEAQELQRIKTYSFLTKDYNRKMEQGIYEPSYASKLQQYMTTYVSEYTNEQLDIET